MKFTPLFIIGRGVRLWSFLVAALIFAPNLATPAAPSSPSSLFPDPVVARGKGVLVRRTELEDAFIAYKSNMAAREQPIPESQRAVREAQLLERLIVTQLLVNRTTDADRARARETAVKVLADSKKSSPSEEMFIRHLKAMGLSIDQFNVRVMEQALAEAVLEREVKSQVAISDAQVEEFYGSGSDLVLKMAEAELARMKKNPGVSVDDLTQGKERIEMFRKANLARLQQPERIRVSHIYLATRDRDSEQELSAEKKQAKRKLMEKLQARVRAGEDFDRLIQEYSEDRSLQETKGEYTFTREARFAPEFKAAAFSLQPGQLSDVVTTFFGYHVIKLHERIPAKKIPLKEAFADIKQFLVEQELQRRMPEYFTRLKKEAGVEILDPKYEIPLPKDIDPLPPGS